MYEQTSLPADCLTLYTVYELPLSGGKCFKRKVFEQASDSTSSFPMQRSHPSRGLVHMLTAALE